MAYSKTREVNKMVVFYCVVLIISFTKPYYPHILVEITSSGSLVKTFALGLFSDVHM